ncbi:MAG: hypothetical protein D6715_05925 [Calditrichaeota bacterium]|nr:MAG: hypothetical protein D6715_05925 [Calditrichota bacterium]
MQPLFAVLLVLALVEGCSRPHSREAVLFPDQFFTNQSHHYDRLIDQALQQLKGNPRAPLATIKLSYGCLRMLELLVPLVELNEQLQAQLNAQLALHGDLPNVGAGYHLQRAIYWFSRNDKKQAAAALQQFQARFNARRLPGVYRRLVAWLAEGAEDPPPSEKSPVRPRVKGQQSTGIVPLTDIQAVFREKLTHSDFPELWDFYRQQRSALLAPVFHELVTDTSSRAVLKQVEKLFYNPTIYRDVVALYRKGLVHAAAAFAGAVKPAWVNSLDSSDQRAFFYLTLYLSESGRWLAADTARIFLQAAQMLRRSPFQKQLFQLHQQWLARRLSAEQLLKTRDLSSEPYENSLLTIWGLWLASWQEAPAFPEAQLQNLHNLILKASPDPAARNQALALLGMLSCRLARPDWALASRCLSPSFDLGYDTPKADPVKMAYLSLAFFNDPLQMDAGKGLIEQLVKRCDILEPIRNDYIRLLSFVYAK